MSDTFEAPKLSPGFRDPALSNDVALIAMHNVCAQMESTALEERRYLLSIGFSDEHSMCKELDAVAQRWSDSLLVVRRQRLGDT